MSSLLCKIDTSALFDFIDIQSLNRVGEFSACARIDNSKK